MNSPSFFSNIGSLEKTHIYVVEEKNFKLNLCPEESQIRLRVLKLERLKEFYTNKNQNLKKN